MEAGKNSVIYMGLILGPNKADDTRGPTTVTGTMDRGFTVYAILQCAYENIRRAYTHNQILIFPDSQPALKALSSPKVTSRLVAEHLDANWNEVTLIEVPGHSGIPRDEKADELAGQGAALL
jgi:ribonuclease HI